jgi:hypothetical protein
VIPHGQGRFNRFVLQVGEIHIQGDDSSQLNLAMLAPESVKAILEQAINAELAAD